MQISVAFPSNLAMFRFCFPLLLSLSSSLFFSPLFCNSQRERVDLSHKSRAKKGTRRRTRTKRSHKVDWGKRTKGEKQGGSSAEWNPFRNCKPPCSIPFLHRLYSYPDILPRSFPRLLPSGKATPPALLTPRLSHSLGFLSLSGASMLVSNTDIEPKSFFP